MSVRPHTRTEMYAGHVTCRPMVSHVEYAQCALLKLEKKMGQTVQTDGCHADWCITLNAVV